ncbi:MAG: hypothetical protein GYB68_08590 [Chloroflexi bacterium]|nr:hypothetical protein [Chloroflexota bacterium]
MFRWTHWVAWLAVALLLIGCGTLQAPNRSIILVTVTSPPVTSATATPTELPPSPTPTETPLPSQTPLPTETPRPSVSLPASLYYIGEDWQIWRLEANGEEVSRITNEDGQILDFAVSPVDGSLAYVVNNNLINTDAGGANRQVLVEGPELPAFPDQTLNWTMLHSIAWSPDGTQIAYGLGGVNLIDPITGEIDTIRASSYSTAQFTEFDPGRFYFPEAWSPDGTRLLVRITTLPISEGFGVIDVRTRTVSTYEIADGEPVCCTASWTQDQEGFFAANDIAVGATTGLWQVDAFSRAVETVLPGEAGGLYFRLSYPQQLDDGNLYFFMTTLANYTPERVALSMHRALADDINDREMLRQDAHVIADVLWAPDGSGAIIVDITEGYVDVTNMVLRPFIAPLLWLDTEGDPAVSFDVAGRRPTWGVTP